MSRHAIAMDCGGIGLEVAVRVAMAKGFFVAGDEGGGAGGFLKVEMASHHVDGFRVGVVCN